MKDGEKRSKPRNLKRLFVRFGPEKPDNIAFTEDISVSGLFIKTKMLFPPGSTLILDIELPDSRILHLKGTVMWSKKVPPAMLRHMKKTGMAIRIIEPPAEYTEFVSRLV
jgi:hypothetical protein